MTQWAVRVTCPCIQIIIYMNPLKEDHRVIPITDHQLIFPNVLHVIYNLHNQLLAELDYTYSLCHDQSDSGLVASSNIGRVMLQYSPLFKMYQIYMNGYERSQKALTMAKQKNRRFAKWLQVQPAGNLESLLILPVWEIPFCSFKYIYIAVMFWWTIPL